MVIFESYVDVQLQDMFVMLLNSDALFVLQYRHWFSVLLITLCAMYLFVGLMLCCVRWALLGVIVISLPSHMLLALPTVAI